MALEKTKELKNLEPEDAASKEFGDLVNLLMNEAATLDAGLESLNKHLMSAFLFVDEGNSKKAKDELKKAIDILKSFEHE